VTVAAILGFVGRTYVSGDITNSALSDSTALYTFDIYGADSNSTCPRPPLRMPDQSGPAPWMANFTDEQRQMLNDTINKLKVSGATREQIRDSVNELLTQWGISIPQQTGTPHPLPPWMANLTAQQIQTLNETTKSMEASGATREQIKTAVNELLTQWGIAIPEDTPTRHPPQSWVTNQTGTQLPQPPWMANLTDQQKQTLEETVNNMKASGATPEQIRNALNELLRQWGIEIPQCP